MHESAFSAGAGTAEPLMRCAADNGVGLAVSCDGQTQVFYPRPCLPDVASCWLSDPTLPCHRAGSILAARSAPGIQARCCLPDGSAQPATHALLNLLVNSLLALRQRQRTATRLAARLSLLDAIYSAADPSDARRTAAAALSGALQAAQAEAGAVFSASSDDGALTPLADVSLSAAELAAAARLLARLPAHIASDDGLVVRQLTGELGRRWDKSWAALTPLPARGQVVGAAVLLRPLRAGRFQPFHLEALVTWARALGSALSVASLWQRVETIFYSSVRALAAAVEAKDPSTRGHSQRVASLAVAVGRRLGLAPDILRDLHLAGLLHDIGKIGVDDATLRKPGPLTPTERMLIRAHPIHSAEIVAHMPGLERAVEAIKYHHERMDGSGYPEGLAGEQIPLLARILAVCDVYDALTSHRPYRAAVPPAQALEELRRNSPKLYDEKVVAALQAALEERGEV